MARKNEYAAPLIRRIARAGSALERGDLPGMLALAAAAALLWWLCRYHASWMPVWAPWDFSVLWFLGFGFTLWWYARGLAAVPQPWWRIGLFLIGMGAIWGVLQTHFEYLAQHMFFLNRIQHLVMHHLGPLLIAVAWPWETIRAGMPARLARATRHRRVSTTLGWFRQPEVAAGLFVGLVALWLWPSIHFVAMIDPRLYQVMNWSMVVDGVLFWAVVLDPRPQAEMGLSYAARAVMAVIVILPQIAIGAVIAFAGHDLYRFYAWCGRIYTGIDALSDQRIGGLFVWVPPAMMSVIALLLVLNAMRADEERIAPEPGEGSVSSARWTGR